MRLLGFKYIASSLLLCLAPALVSASSLSDSLIVRAGYDFGTPSSRSFDGPNADFVSPFLAFTDGNFYQLGSFLAPLAESWSLVAEVAGNRNSNTLGVEDQFGVFTSFILGSDSVPDSGVLNLTDNDEYTFALNGVGGQRFYSVDSRNTDGGAAHFLALNITQAANVVMPDFSIIGVLPGDIILAIEDLPSNRWDWDYNDMVVVMREVPEPASMLLLASGVGALAARRRRRVVAYGN